MEHKEHEKVCYLVETSIWVTIFWGIFALVLAPLIIPFFYGLWKGYQTAVTKYYVYDDRIVEVYGLFNLTEREIDFYRVKSAQHRQPLLYRIFGLGSIDIVSSDKHMPTLTVNGINNSRWLYNGIRKMSQEKRKEYGVTETDHYML